MWFSASFTPPSSPGQHKGKGGNQGFLTAYILTKAVEGSKSISKSDQHSHVPGCPGHIRESTCPKPCKDTRQTLTQGDFCPTVPQEAAIYHCPRGCLFRNRQGTLVSCHPSEKPVLQDRKDRAVILLTKAWTIQTVSGPRSMDQPLVRLGMTWSHQQTLFHAQMSPISPFGQTDKYGKVKEKKSQLEISLAILIWDKIDFHQLLVPELLKCQILDQRFWWIIYWSLKRQRKDCFKGLPQYVELISEQDGNKTILDRKGMMETQDCEQKTWIQAHLSHLLVTLNK